MLSLEEMRKLRDAYAPHQPILEEEVLQEIGNPTPEEIVDTALEGLHSEDRNVRVLMVRVLKGQAEKDSIRERAMQGILTGLGDEKRRVKEVAIKSCQPFLHYPEISGRLEEMVTDPNEHSKVRSAALLTLTGHGGQFLLKILPKAAADALDTLAQNEQYRAKILFQLLQLDLSDHVEALLKEFVKNGSKEEAVMATRALCGYRVIHLVEFENDKKMIRYIEQNCESAAGRVFYWMERSEFANRQK